MNACPGNSIRPNRPDDIVFDGGIYESQFPTDLDHPQPDVPFWLDLAKRFGPRVLELACGTGRVTIPLYENGIKIDGVDFSESMLRIARERADSRLLPVKFIYGDIRRLTFQDQYDFMFLPSRTISHLITRTDLESFLAGVRQALRRDGVFALDVHNPTATWLNPWPFPERQKRSTFVHRETGQTIAVISSLEYSAETQLLSIRNCYDFPDGSTKEGTIMLRLYFPAELRALLHYNGFDVLQLIGGFDGDVFTAGSSIYVIVAKPRP